MDSSLNKRDCNDYLVPLLLELRVFVKHCDLQKAEDLSKFAFFFEVLDFFTCKVAQIVALWEHFTYVNAVVPNQVLHVVRQPYLCCQCLESLNMVDVLFRSNRNPESVPRFNRVEEFPCLTLELVFFPARLPVVFMPPTSE